MTITLDFSSSYKNFNTDKLYYTFSDNLNDEFKKSGEYSTDLIYNKTDKKYMHIIILI